MPISTLGALLLGALFGCVDDACTAYVDYMCDCHAEDTDCGELERAYSNADADLQDECIVALEDQQDQDAADGLECPADTGAGGA
jgi:hypothetical protein